MKELIYQGLIGLVVGLWFMLFLYLESRLKAGIKRLYKRILK